MKNKKLIYTLGSIATLGAVVAPIAAITSCSCKGDGKVTPVVEKVEITSSVSLLPRNISKEVKFVAKVSGTGSAEGSSVEWFSSNTKALKIDKNSGIITVVAPGEAVVSAISTLDASKYDKVTVTVSEHYEIKSASFGKPHVEMEVGHTVTIPVVFDPTEAKAKSVIYKSSDSSVVKIIDEATGEIEAVAKGENVTITANVVDMFNNELTATYTISVTQDTNVTIKGDNNVELDMSKKLYQFQAIDSKGNDVTDKCEWTIDNEDVGTFDTATKGQLNFLGNSGHANVTATLVTEDGDVINAQHEIEVGTFQCFDATSLSSGQVKLASSASISGTDIFIPSHYYNGTKWQVITSIATEGLISTNVSSIGTLHIPATISTINYHIVEAEKVKHYSVNPKNSNYTSRDSSSNECDCIMNADRTMVIVGNATTTWPSSITTIGDYAFANVQFSKTTPDFTNITTIGSHAYNSTNITSVTIPASVNQIGEYAFYGCSGVTEGSFKMQASDKLQRQWFGLVGNGARSAHWLPVTDDNENWKFISQEGFNITKMSGILYEYTCATDTATVQQVEGANYSANGVTLVLEYWNGHSVFTVTKVADNGFANNKTIQSVDLNYVSGSLEFGVSCFASTTIERINVARWQDVPTWSGGTGTQSKNAFATRKTDGYVFVYSPVMATSMQKLFVEELGFSYNVNPWTFTAK